MYRAAADSFSWVGDIDIYRDAVQLQVPIDAPSSGILPDLFISSLAIGIYNNLVQQMGC